MYMKRKVTLILAMMLLVLTASAKKGPKYVFYFIGDGMGTNQVMGIQYYLQDIEGKYGYKPLCFTQFPYTGLVRVRRPITTFLACCLTVRLQSLLLPRWPIRKVSA